MAGRTLKKVANTIEGPATTVIQARHITRGCNGIKRQTLPQTGLGALPIRRAVRGDWW
jgi:hypothetical protein